MKLLTNFLDFIHTEILILLGIILVLVIINTNNYNRKTEEERK